MALASDMKNMLATARDHYNQGQFQVAEKLLEEIILTESTNPEAFHLLGTVYYKRGKIKKAVKAFRRALEIDPTFTDSTVGLSMVLNDTGRYDEARQVFEEGQKQVQNSKRQELSGFLDEQIAAKHTELGDLYFQAQRYDEAIDQFFEAYKYSAQKIDLRMKIVDVFTKKGDINRAIKELKLLVQERPHLAKARIKLGMIFYKDHRILEAVEQWETVLLRDPENPEALKLLQMSQNKQTTLLA